MDEQMIKITEACGDIDKRIAACKTKTIAEMLKSQLCRELAKSCESEIILNVLLHYVNSIIRTTFDKNGKNKLMED